jgi:hypothetical protein
VVDVQPGSAAVTLQIVDESPTVITDPNDNSTYAAAEAQQARLVQLAAQVTSMAESGQLATIGGYAVLSISVSQPPPLDGSSATSEPVTSVPVSPTNTINGTGSLSMGVIAGIAVGSALGVLVIAAAFVIARGTRHHGPLVVQKKSPFAVYKSSSQRTVVDMGLGLPDDEDDVPADDGRQKSMRRIYNPILATGNASETVRLNTFRKSRSRVKDDATGSTRSLNGGASQSPSPSVSRAGSGSRFKTASEPPAEESTTNPLAAAEASIDSVSTQSSMDAAAIAAAASDTTKDESKPE